MIKNKTKNRWEITDPVHLIGWEIETFSEIVDEHFTMVTLVRQNKGREKRTAFIRMDIIPLTVLSRNYKE